MSSSSKSLVEKVYSFLEEADLFVWDFSILMTMDNIQLINWLANMAIKNKKKILVPEEFYRCYSIVVKSSSAEQREIAQNTKALLTLLKNHSALASASKYRTTESLVKALQSNPKVAFLVAANSEAAELLVSSDKTQAMILAITQEGKLCCCDRDKLATLINTEVNNDKKNKFVLSIENPPKVGSVLKTADGKEYVLKKEISSGAEGVVYFTNDDSYVCKVFHEKQLSVLRCKKLKFFEQRQVRYDGICWPEKIVYTQEGKPVGYIMQRAYGKDMSKIFDGEESIQEYFPTWKRIDLVDLSIKILEKFMYLHLLGIKIGDIRMQNIVLGRDGSVYLIDMDSCQIEDFPCPFGDEDFTPAENQGKSFDSFLRTYRNERFSIYVLIFTVLFLGAHPYAQKNGADTIAEEIFAHAFPYPQNRSQPCPRAPMGGFDLIWNITPQNICNLFYDCFRLDKRADIVELLLLLDNYKKELQSRNSPKDRGAALGFDEEASGRDAMQRNINVTPIHSSSASNINYGGGYGNGGYNGYGGQGYNPSGGSGNYVQNNTSSTGYTSNTGNSTAHSDPPKKKRSAGTVILWLIILVCIYLLVTLAMIYYSDEASAASEIYIKPIVENLLSSIHLGG